MLTMAHFEKLRRPCCGERLEKCGAPYTSEISAVLGSYTSSDDGQRYHGDKNQAPVELLSSEKGTPRISGITSGNDRLLRAQR